LQDDNAELPFVFSCSALLRAKVQNGTLALTEPPTPYTFAALRLQRAPLPAAGAVGGETGVPLAAERRGRRQQHLLRGWALSASLSAPAGRTRLVTSIQNFSCFSMPWHLSGMLGGDCVLYAPPSSAHYDTLRRRVLHTFFAASAPAAPAAP